MLKSIPFLWGLVILLLILNLILLDSLNLARRTAIETLSQVESTLDRLAGEVIVYQVAVDQAVPIRADVPINQTLSVPLNTVVPLDQIFTVPVQVGATQMELTMPVKTELPLNLVIPVDFNDSIVVNTTVQLETTLPVTIDIAQTPLAGYLQEARGELVRLRQRLTLPVDRPSLTGADEAVAPASPTTAEAETSRSGSPAVAVATVAATLQAAVTVTEPAPTVAAVAKPASFNPLTPAEVGPCDHPYWPLRPATVWRYRSPATDYPLQIDAALVDDQFVVGSQYEATAVSAEVACSEQGWGGPFLGELRRWAELGELQFSQANGLFLPAAALLEQPGYNWQQSFAVGGRVAAYQGSRPVWGQIRQGQGRALYQTSGRELVDSRLGLVETIRLEQKIHLELPLEFQLADGIRQATASIDLTNVYWLADEVGLVKMQWQGGPITWNFDGQPPPDQYPTALPALPEERLVSICPAETTALATCLQLVEPGPATLSDPPSVELELPPLRWADRGASPAPTASPPLTGPTPETSPDEPADQNPNRAALLAYAAAVARLGDRINRQAETFADIALGFRAGDLTLAEFESRFDSFASSMRAQLAELAGLSPPPPAAEIHTGLTGGLAKCEEGLDLMEGWFEQPDSDTKEATMLLVAACVSEVTIAAEKLEQLVAE